VAGTEAAAEAEVAEEAEEDKLLYIIYSKKNIQAIYCTQNV